MSAGCRAVSGAENAILKVLWEQPITCGAIAKHMGLTAAIVSKRARRLKLPPRPLVRAPGVMTPERTAWLQAAPLSASRKQLLAGLNALPGRQIAMGTIDYLLRRYRDGVLPTVPAGRALSAAEHWDVPLPVVPAAHPEDATIDDARAWMRQRRLPMVRDITIDVINAERRARRLPAFRLVVSVTAAGAREWAVRRELPEDAPLATINAMRVRMRLPPFVVWGAVE